MLYNMNGSGDGDAEQDITKERPRGMLTEADRRYLRGEEQFDNENTENSKRHRIRKRIRNAILDFSVAHDNLQRNDVGMIYNDEEKHELQDAMIDALAFLYLGSVRFEKMVEAGIERAVREHTEFEMPEVSVILNVDRDPTDMKTYLEKLQNDETLPPKTVGEMVEFSPPLKDEHRRVLEQEGSQAARVLLSADDAARKYGEGWGEEWELAEPGYTKTSDNAADQ